VSSPFGQTYLLNRKTGSAQMVVNTGIVKSWPVPVPPLDVQHEIVGKLEDIAIKQMRLRAIIEEKRSNLLGFKAALQAQLVDGVDRGAK